MPPEHFLNQLTDFIAPVSSRLRVPQFLAHRFNI